MKGFTLVELFIVMMIVGLIIAGVQKGNEIVKRNNDINSSDYKSVDNDNEIFERRYVTKDPKTGCEYIETSGGVTPRLDTFGEHICN